MVVVAIHEIAFLTHFWDRTCNPKTTDLGKRRKEGGNLSGGDGVRGGRAQRLAQVPVWLLGARETEASGRCRGPWAD